MNLRRTWILSALFGTVGVSAVEVALAAAPVRPGKPYAEAAKCAEADVIFCEDFDDPANFTYTGSVTNDNTDWFRPPSLSLTRI